MRILVFFFLSIICVSPAIAQQQKEETPPLRERLFYGGNFGLQFGTITDIQVSPVIGLWIFPRLNVAVGPNYRFYKEKIQNYPTIRTDIYGGKVYTEFVLLRDINSFIPLGANTGIVAHLEDEFLSLESIYFDPLANSKRFIANAVLAGGGLSQQIGRKGSMNFLFLWAIDGTDYGIYGKPEIRISFTF